MSINSAELTELRAFSRQLLRFIENAERDNRLVCPVSDFVCRRLTTKYACCDISTQELWELYECDVAAGVAPSVRKGKFQRLVSEVIGRRFGIRRSTSLRRDGRRVRGFPGVSVAQPLPQPNLD